MVIDDFVTGGSRKIARMAEKPQTVSALPARVRIGEVHADIAQRGSSEQCVRYSVRQDVGVGMAFEAKFAWDRDAPQNTRSSRRDAMNVPPETSAIFTQERILPWRRGAPVPCRWAW